MEQEPKGVLSPSSQELSLYGRIGAYESWARTSDRTARTANARAAFMARFDDYPDPDAARKAHFQRLALKSAQARKKRKAR
jgi:hypothetical protein